MALIQSDEGWICPVCSEELGDYNGYCEYCWQLDKIKVYNPDKYYIREVCIYHITHRTSVVSEMMTPQEELFAQLFNHEKALVKDMETLQLRAHREELSKIAFEARARLTAVDDEEQTRKKLSNKNGKPQGFSRSVNTDETTTNAINAIKERQKRITKAEKIQAGLEDIFVKSGMSLAEAQKEARRLMGAGTILQQVNPGRVQTETIKEQDQTDTIAQPDGHKDKQTEQSKTFSNPFAKKDN